ncbi:retinol dehydrogenase 11-like [Planoprotostelium fungivorum]|uniref:Retinol dehydrogenase 11-like n=1 Tax=Planoprotostelium fungivorum TaxID=1890364 RepID=A0A2P6NFJ7_9EUKA|nr:retinol dehydrogenase 11-like [Planoprotostelium fungivorum]
MILGPRSDNSEELSLPREITSKARQQQHTPGNMGANLSYEANDLSGKNVIVTGGNAGIGLVTARELAKLGASVTIACRDPTRAQNAVEELSKVGANVQTLPLDLASFESVQTFAKSYGEKHDALHILVLNAGIMALPERKTTKDGLEMQMGTNHFGHFLLTGLLMDRLKAAQGARVVTVASSAHQMASLDLDDLQSEKNYSKWKAYGNSKLANVLFAKELQKRSDANGWKIDAFSVHPGVIGTDLWNHNSGVQGAFLRFGRKFMRDTEEGAKTSLYCAVDRDAEKNKGGYFSDCAPKSGTSATRDDELAAGLWEKSEDICKVKYDA